MKIDDKINPKTAGGGRRGCQFACGFSKNVSSKERVKPFSVTFDIILRHIFPENFIEFRQVVQEI